MASFFELFLERIDSIQTESFSRISWDARVCPASPLAALSKHSDERISILETFEMLLTNVNQIQWIRTPGISLRRHLKFPSSLPEQVTQISAFSNLKAELQSSKRLILEWDSVIRFRCEFPCASLRLRTSFVTHQWTTSSFQWKVSAIFMFRRSAPSSELIWQISDFENAYHMRSWSSDDSDRKSLEANA